MGPTRRKGRDRVRMFICSDCKAEAPSHAVSATDGRQTSLLPRLPYFTVQINKLILKRQYKPGWIFQDTCKLWSHCKARFISSDETPPSENLGTMVTARLRRWWLTHSFISCLLMKSQLCMSLTLAGDRAGSTQADNLLLVPQCLA